MSIIQRWRERRLRKETEKLQAAFRKVNATMKKLGWTRQRRRVFWRDFSKSPNLREEIVGALTGPGKPH